MKKMKEFCKKPLAIISAAVLVVFLVVLISINCISHGTTYRSTQTIEDTTYETVISFNGDKMTYETIVDGKSLSGDELPEFEYEIKDGKLFMKGTASLLPTSGVEITPFEIKIVNVLDKDNPTVLKCNLTIAFDVISIIMVCVSGIALITSLVFILLDKKGKAKA